MAFPVRFDSRPGQACFGFNDCLILLTPPRRRTLFRNARDVILNMVFFRREIVQTGNRRTLLLDRGDFAHKAENVVLVAYFCSEGITINCSFK